MANSLCCRLNTLIQVQVKLFFDIKRARSLDKRGVSLAGGTSRDKRECAQCRMCSVTMSSGSIWLGRTLEKLAQECENVSRQREPLDSAEQCSLFNISALHKNCPGRGGEMKQAPSSLHTDTLDSRQGV